MTSRTFVVVGYSNLGAVPALLKKGRSLNFDRFVILCNQKDQLDRSIIDEPLNEIYELDVCSSTDLLRACEIINFKCSTDVFICLQDRPMLAYLDAIQHLFCQTNRKSPIPIQGIRRSRIKPLTRHELDLHGVNNATWTICRPDSVSDTVNMLVNTGLKKFFVKPVAGMGSELVQEVSAYQLENTLKQNFNRAAKHFGDTDYTFLINGESYATNSTMLVEEALIGPEYTVDGYIKNGHIEAIAQHKETRKTTPFIGDGLIVSPPYKGKDSLLRIPDAEGYEVSQKSEIDERVLIEYCHKVLTCLSIENWVFHIELIDKRDPKTGRSLGPCLVEINPRCPGGLLARSFLLRKGINLIEASIDLYMGNEFSVKEKDCVTGQFPIYWEREYITKLSQLPNDHGIRNLDFLQLCEPLDKYKDGQENYLAFVMLKAENHTSVRRAAQQTFEALKELSDVDK